MEFNRNRLRQARERRSLFVKDLAAACNVTQQAVIMWESGTRNPSPESLAAISEALGFLPEFFSREDAEALPAGAANFRSRSKLAIRDRDAALRAGELAMELAAWIEARFELPPVGIPDLRGQEPNLAAELVRQSWLLGEKPIPDVIQLLESRGVLVFSLAQDCLKIDAFSFWMNRRPIILLNNQKSAERSRFDAAHELGHLVNHVEETGKREEHEADAFAGAFLMPKADLLQNPPGFPSLDVLIAAKRRWGVSLASFVYRLHEIGWLTAWQYRTLFVELSQRGYRQNEPDSKPRDTSALLRKVFTALREDRISAKAVASELGWRQKDLADLVFNLGATIVGLDGGGVSSGAPTSSLRLVD